MVFVYILYNKTVVCEYIFRYMIYMISHLIFQYHRIAILNAIKIYKIQVECRFFFSILTQNFIIRAFLEYYSNTFSSAKIVSAVQLTFRHNAIHLLMDSQFLLNSKGR